MKIKLAFICVLAMIIMFNIAIEFFGIFALLTKKDSEKDYEAQASTPPPVTFIF